MEFRHNCRTHDLFDLLSEKLTAISAKTFIIIYGVKDVARKFCDTMKFGRIITLAAMAPLGIGFIYIGKALFVGTATIQKLFTENNQLKQSLAHLTSEEQIGYTKFVGQEIASR